MYLIYTAFFTPTFIHMQNCPWYSEANRMPFSKWNTWKEDYFYFRPLVYFNLFADKRQNQQGRVRHSRANSKCKNWHPDLCFNRHNISLKIVYSSHKYQGPCDFKSKQTAFYWGASVLRNTAFTQINEYF